jgi:hypothetical protein
MERDKKKMDAFHAPGHVPHLQQLPVSCSPTSSSSLFAIAMNFQRRERRRERDHRLVLVRSLDAFLLYSNGKGSSRERETNRELENQIRIDSKEECSAEFGTGSKSWRRCYDGSLHSGHTTILDELQRVCLSILTSSQTPRCLHNSLKWDGGRKQLHTVQSFTASFLYVPHVHPVRALSVFQVVIKKIPVWVGLESLLSSLPL